MEEDYILEFNDKISKEELSKRLNNIGQRLTNRVLKEWNVNVKNLDKLFRGLKRYVDSADDGLTQPSAAFGSPRAITMKDILREYKYNTTLRGRGHDMLLVGHPAEIKGTFKHHYKPGYGAQRNPKKHNAYDYRIHIFTYEKINVAEARIDEIKLEILNIPSRYFIPQSDKTNMCMLDRSMIKDEDIIGVWTAYHKDVPQRHLIQHNFI